MASPSTITFGTLLRQLRRRAQMTQADLAAAVGYSVSFISSLEQNTRHPDVHSVLQHFVPALALQDEPHLATHLLQLAAAAQGDLPPPAALTVTRERRILITETNAAPPTNLPTPPTPLIGREQTVKMLCDRLLGHQGRLLTLVGPPGVGKTRLALAVAADLQPFHPDGVYFVPLAPVSDPDLVAAALVGALGLIESNPKPPLSRLLAFLRHKELLLLLDNFEQVIAAAPLVAELLAGCPRLRVLVTSRERLHLRAEQRYKVPPLDLVPAVELFVERVRAMEPDFTLTTQNQVIIGEICQALDCLPLALELGAAHIALFTPQMLLARLKEERLDLLNTGPCDLPLRQRSLRAAFDHSWKLLGYDEQQVLMRLSLFRSGCTQQAAEAVAGATLSILMGLIDKSLLYRVTTGIQDRFFLHELIRQYAAEHLQIQPFVEEVEQRFAEFFVTQTEAVVPKLDTDNSLYWRSQITVDQDNLRMILQHCLTEQRNANLGLRLAATLGRYWCSGDAWKEGRDWLVRALAFSKQEGASRALALTSLGELYHLLGDQPKAEQTLTKALQHWRMLDDLGNTAWTLLQLSKPFAIRAAYAEADAYLSESLSIYRQLGDQQRIVTLLGQLSAVAIERGDYPRAVALLEELLPSVRTANRPRSLAVNLNFYGRALLGQGDAMRALPLFMEALTIFEAEEAESGIAWSLINLGLTQRAAGNLANAINAYCRCFLVYHKLEGVGGMMAALEGLASVLAPMGDVHRAVQLLATAETLRQQSGRVLTLYELEIQQQTFDLTHAALAQPVWDMAWHAGKQLSVAQLVSLVSDQIASIQ